MDTAKWPRQPVPQLAMKNFFAIRWPPEFRTLTTIAASKTSDVPVTRTVGERWAPIAGLLTTIAGRSRAKWARAMCGPARAHHRST